MDALESARALSRGLEPCRDMVGKCVGADHPAAPLMLGQVPDDLRDLLIEHSAIVGQVPASRDDGSAFAYRRALDIARRVVAEFAATVAAMGFAG